MKFLISAIVILSCTLSYSTEAGYKECIIEVSEEVSYQETFFGGYQNVYYYTGIIKFENDYKNSYQKEAKTIYISEEYLNENSAFEKAESELSSLVEKGICNNK